MIRALTALVIAAGFGLAAVTALTGYSPAASTVIIVDGDTIKVSGVTIRLLEIDTPETYRSRCENELVQGLKAKERLRALLDAGPVSYDAHGHDRYGRTLAYVYAGGVDVGAVLLEEGYALPYEPGKAAKLERLQHWCGPDAQL